VKVKFKGEVYDVVDTYSHGVVIPLIFESVRTSYKYRGVMHSDVEVVDDSAIEYRKVQIKLLPKVTVYKTQFVNKNFDFSKLGDIDRDVMLVFNDYVVFRSPGFDDLTQIPVKHWLSQPNGDNWGFIKSPNGNVTLSPSIKIGRPDGQEHFFIRDSKVMPWLTDSYEYVYKKK